jgi:PAS domain S-box-containing protein
MSGIDFNSLELLPGIALALDSSGTIVHLNEACASLAGRSAQELLGEPVWQLMAEPEDVTRVQELLEVLRAGVPAKPLEVSWKRSRGERRCVALVGALVPGAGADQPMFVLTGVDITQIVASRDYKLERLGARSKLERARRETLAAQRAIAARDEVLATIAHELRNPLNTVLLQSEVLRIRGVAADRSLDAIRRAALRMNRLVGDMLDISRLDAGTLALELTAIPIQPLLEEAVGSLSDRAVAAQVSVVIDADQPLPELVADHDRILQVFDNLIGNAIKFTTPGGRVVVGATPAMNEVLFRVSDTGVGVSHDKLTHVFDRFWQADKSDRRGAGLGLPIVKGIIEAHGGKIWVESEPGRGTTFYFTMPAVPTTSS